MNGVARAGTRDADEGASQAGRLRHSGGKRCRQRHVAAQVREPHDGSVCVVAADQAEW